MNNIGKYKNKFLIGLFSIILILTLSIVLIPNNNTDIELLIENFKEELVENIGNYDTRQIVLKDTSKSEAESLAKRLNAKLRITKDGSFAALTLPIGVTIDDIVNDSNNRDIVEKFSIDYQATISEVEEIEEEYITKPSKYTPNDEYYSKQTYLDYLNLSDVWNSYEGDGITVAVIDTGIDTDHPDLVGKISEYSYNATYDKIVKDYKLSDGSYDWSLVEDIQGHGTAVTGVIAASMNNSIGITGIAPNVEIITIKAECDEKGNFKRTSDLVFGLYYAIERDVDIVNMSFGGSSPTNPYEAATRLAVDSDIICVAAAGNEGNASLTYPAADPNVIGVGALAEDSWELADYSNFGENSDIVAPGTVYTCKNDGTYQTISGTSFSSPIVAGVLALLKGKDRYKDFEYIQELIYASSMDMGEIGNDFYFGYGAIDTSALILETRLTVTFNYLTDEIKSTEQIFIKGHTLQNIPEPERNYAVYDGWYYDIHCYEEYNLYSDIWTSNLTLYCNWVNEDDGVPYTYVELEDGTIEIRSYTGKRRYITIPEYIDGKVVSSIGVGAFENETRLRLVNLPAQLKYIKDNAFANCTNITSMTIPSSVESIGPKAFSNNIRLYNLNIEADSKLKTIGSFAFESCSLLVRIDLPSSLEKVDGSSFLGCTALKQINVDKKNKNYVSTSGVLYNKSKTTLVAYPAGLSEETYDLPNTVKTLGAYSFAFSQIKTIELKNVTSIEEAAFTYSKIETINIPDSVTKLGESTFAYSNIKNITLGHGITSISKGCFIGTLNLKEIIIPNTIKEICEKSFLGSLIEKVTFEENSMLEIIGSESFNGTLINELDLPNSTLCIGINAFSKSKLEEINISNNSNLMYIGASAFENTLISEFNFPEKLHTIGEFAFKETYLIEVNLPAYLVNYAPSAFASCHSLENIYIDDNNKYYVDVDGVVYTVDLKIIYEYPAGRNVSSYTILSSVETIGQYSFYGSYNLKSVVLPEGVKVVDEYAFYECINVTSYSLPNSLQEIRRESFAYNSNLYSISIPDNVIQISNYAFKNNYNMTSVYLSDNSKLPRLSYGAFAYTGIYDFRIPSNVSTISQDVFIGCPNLYSVTFAAGSKLESVSAYLFKGCNSLRTITFENGSALTNIQAHAFEGMSNLQTINFGDAQITNIDNFAFRYCESLQSINIPNTVEYIGRYAFYGCKTLSSVTIPESVEYIGKYAFHMTNDLDVYFTDNTLPEYLQENWDYGIRGYYVGVKEVYTEGDLKFATLNNDTTAIIEYNGNSKNVDLTLLNKTITQIGGSAFKGSSIESIVLPTTLKTIEKNAFANTKLKNITIPSNVEYLGDNAFQSSKIEKVTFESNVNLTKIGMYAFSNTYNLKEIIIPKSVTNLGSYAFQESGLEKVTFESGINLETINEGTFQKTKLTSVVIPNSVTLIDHNAFRDIETLQQVEFNDQELIIMSNVFYNTGLTSVNIPANLKYIGEYAFVGLKNLTGFNVDVNNKYYKSVNGVLYSKDGRKLIAYPAGLEGTFMVPKHVETLGFGAFENSKLSSVTFEEGINLLTLGYRAFYNASIRSISIPESVVSIDYYAFAMNKYLESVKFSENNKLSGIYEGAFYGCINLTDITIPDNIYEISDYAFSGCLKLEKLPISENSMLMGIYDYAFSNSGLKEVNLPGSLIDIGSYAFQGIEATEITVPSNNKEQLIIGFGAFAETNNLESIALPFIGATLNDEEYSWFGYIFGAGEAESQELYVPTSLKEVTISEGQTFIGYMAFKDLEHIEVINFPTTIDTVYEEAMINTNASYELVGKIEVKNILNSSQLIMGWFGSGIRGTLDINPGEKQICYGENDKGNKLEKIIISGEVTDIGMWAFVKSKDLKTVVIPDTIKLMSYYVFEGCENLKEVYYYGTIEDWVDIEFAYWSSNPMAYAEHFYMKDSNNEWYEVTEIVIPDTVTCIGNYQFYGFENLIKVTIPSSVTSIGFEAFSGCEKLKELIIEENSELESIDTYSFAYCNIQKIINNSNLTFEFNSFEYGEIASNAVVIVDKNGVETYKDGHIIKDDFVFKYERNTYKLINYIGSEDTVTLPLDINGEKYTIYQMKGVKNVIIPEGFTEINDSAFENCTSLESITIPNSVTSIGVCAFDYCTNLKEVIFGENSRLSIIKMKAFYNCEKLVINNLPNTITNIGDNAFIGCKIENMESDVFEYENGILYSKENNILYVDRNLTYISIKDNVKQLANKQFENYTNLVDIEIPNSITKIGYSAFENCPNLTNVYYRGTIEDWFKIDFDAINSNPMYYGKHIYMLDENNKWYEVTEIVFPENVTSIPEYQFCGFNSLEKIIIPGTIKEIKERAFWECKNLKEVIILAGVEKIEDEAFYGCTSLTRIEIPNSVTKIGNSVFILCENLESIVIPDSVVELGNAVFRNCYSLNNIRLSNNIERIGDDAFAYCYGLSDINLPDNLKTIGKIVFYSCTNLSVIEIPSTVTSIDSEAFSGCKISKLVNNTNISIDFNYDNILIIVDKNGTATYKDGTIIKDDFVFIYEDNQYKLVSYIGSEDTVTLPLDINGEEYAIYQMKGVKNVIIPEGFTEISGAAFYYCYSLESIIIPDTVTKIGSNAFYGSENLVRIELSNSIDTIEIQAFLNTKYYNTEENWTNGSLYIGDYLISLDKNITSYILPDNIKAIADDAFKECYLLETVEVDSKAINKLYECSNIKTLVLKETINENIIEYFKDSWSGYNIPITLESVVLKEGFNVLNRNTFRKISNVNIFVDHYETDVMWDHDYPGWNNNNKVYYKGEWIETTFYDYDGTIISNEYYTTSQVIRQPILKSFEKDNVTYYFNGWDIDNDGIVDSYPATSNINITAKAIYSTKPTTYTVTYYDIDGKSVLYQDEILKGETLILKDAPSKKGYTFDNWYGYPIDLEVNENIKIYSNWIHNNGGHNYEEIIVESTCTEDGYTKYICIICDEYYITDYISSTGHIYGEWIINTESTCLVEGTKHRECECGNIEYETIDTLDHVFETKTLQDATCEKEGIVEHKCINCQTVYTEYTPTLEHTYVKKYVSKTFLQWLIELVLDIFFGYEGDKGYYYECSVCKHIRTMEESGSSTAGVAGTCEHTEGEWEIVRESSNVEGLKVIKCTKCEEILKMEVLPKTVLSGDLDGNEAVNTSDVIYLLMHTYFPDAYPVEQDCDYTNDGIVNTADVIHLLMHTYFPDAYPIEFKVKKKEEE